MNPLVHAARRVPENMRASGAARVHIQGSPLLMRLGPAKSNLTKNETPAMPAEADPEELAYWMGMIQLKMKDKHSSVMSAFRSLDKDGSGQLDMNEFKTMLVMFNLGDVPDYITHAIYQMVDMDNSGSMSYAEFFRLVKLPIAPSTEELAEIPAPAPQTVAAGRRRITSDSLATIPAPTSAAAATTSAATAAATAAAAAAAATATAAAVKGTSALAKEFIKMPPPPPPPPSALMLKAQAILQRQLQKG